MRETFQDARRDLAATPHDILVTNAKLGTFNGTQLVYLARQANPASTCIVHGDDPGMALDAQQAGAFWERSTFLPFGLPQFFSSTLPASDRRDPRRLDRRLTFRGGRRATDRVELHAAATTLPRLL
ncbi:MAG: hypothetical protein IT184_10050 [Acidobacteria bacterium]|nr:hypothetical protein [Acidobacteriota bacterium]